MAKKQSRIDYEKQIVKFMIELYCKGHKHEKGVPCKECEELLLYATNKLENCKFGEDKTFCNKCSVHCYKLQMKNKIREVMKYSGPRMIFYHPIVAVKHLLDK